MKKIVTVAMMLCATATFAQKAAKVEFKNVPADKKVEVYVDGKLFTNYIYPDNMEKQVLTPIFTASGKEITRGYPLAPRPFERVDHPHHVGMWFNFGDVNGLDFWNNSFAIKPEVKHKYGTVKFDQIVKENPKKGELEVRANWVDIKDNVLLVEDATYVFGGNENVRTIERITKLTAKTDVTLTENKEGLIAIRMDRAFEEPSDKPQQFLDANGIATNVPIMNNDGVNGVYHNAEGVKGGDVWSKKSKWVALRGAKDGEDITVAIIDNKKNVGYPAWSHARGYGLFATNNLGGRAFDKNTDELKVVLKPGESVTFKHLIAIGNLSDADLNALADKF